MFRSLILLALCTSLIGCQDYTSMQSSYEQGRAPTLAELSTLTGIYRGECRFSTDTEEQKKAPPINTVMVFSYSRISASEPSNREFFGANYSEIDGQSIDQTKNINDAYDRITSDYIKNPNGFLGDDDDYYSSTGDYSPNYGEYAGLVGSYAKFEDNAYVCGSQGSGSEEQNYRTSYRLTTNGQVITKITTEVNGIKEEGYCFWYGKLVDGSSFPAAWRGPEDSL